MQTRGVYIARRIRDILASELSAEVPLGVLDVTFYRDDFRTKMKMPEGESDRNSLRPRPKRHRAGG